MKNKLGVDIGNSKLYQKSYNAKFDNVLFPPYWHVPNFVKFNGDDE